MADGTNNERPWRTGNRTRPVVIWAVVVLVITVLGSVLIYQYNQQSFSTQNLKAMSFGDQRMNR
jgi:hypothetical protein